MIEIAKLPLDGLRIEGLSEFVSLEEKEALRGLSWQLFLVPTDKDGYKDIFFDIRADAVYEGFCCRCLEPIDTPMALRAQFLGSSDPNLVARGSYMLGAQDSDQSFLCHHPPHENFTRFEKYVWRGDSVWHVTMLWG